MKKISNLLLDEPPLQVMPTLATKVGLNESIVLQQIHYWLKIKEKVNKNILTVITGYIIPISSGKNNSHSGV